MCGICGFVTKGHGETADLVGMASALSHRGPDDSGYHTETVSPAAGGGDRYTVGLGHRRLSIIDLSTAGHEPMFNEDSSVALVFNGEIYNFQDLRRELAGKGHWFASKTDAEVIIHGFEEWGLDVLDRLNGMFALALWDRRKRRLVLARDRIGIKPLYYYAHDDTLLFASEIGAMRKNRFFDAEIDREAVGLYLDFSYIPAPKTIYRNTFKLLPGEALVWEMGSARRGRYWSLRPDADTSVGYSSFAEAKERCSGLIRESVAMRLASDVPLGAFLSGGYDSSLVVAMMKEAGAPDIDTYSIGFEESAYNEAPYARAVAEHLGTRHHELILTPAEAMKTIGQLSRIYDEPFGDSSALPTYLVSKFARDSGMTVTLSGDGGDELFCGYNRYETAMRLYGLAGIPKSIRRAGTALLRRSPSKRFRRLAVNANFDSLVDLYHQRMSSWKNGNPYSLVARDFSPGDAVTDPGDNNNIYDSITRAGRGNLDARAWGELLFEKSRFRAVFDQFEGRTLPSILSMVDIHTYLVDDILTKVDRASMAVSLEARVPLLDHRVVEFAAGLPSAYLVGENSAARSPLSGVLGTRRGRAGRRGGATGGKRMLKAIAHDYIPPALLERPKQGFAIPVDAWLRGPLRGMLESELAPAKLYDEGLLDSHRVKTVVQDFLGGSDSCSRLVWSLLMLELWVKDSHAKHDTQKEQNDGSETVAACQGVHADSQLPPAGRRS